MPEGPRFSWRAGLVLLAVLGVPLLAWMLLGRSDSGSEGLRLELVSSPPGAPAQLVVSIADQGLNVPETSGGRSAVRLSCTDPRGRRLLSSTHPFPFTDTDGGVEAPHVHQPLDAAQGEAIDRCRLEGTDPELGGEL